MWRLPRLRGAATQRPTKVRQAPEEKWARSQHLGRDRGIREGTWSASRVATAPGASQIVSVQEHAPRLVPVFLRQVRNLDYFLP